MQRLVFKHKRLVKTEPQIWRFVLFHANSHRRTRQPSQKIGFSETMKIDDQIKPASPYVANESMHVSQCRPYGPVTHRNAIDGEHLVYSRTHFRKRRAEVACEQCQPDIGKGVLERRKSRQQKDQISQKSEPDR